VTGQEDEKRISRTFRNTDEGRKAANAFAQGLKNAKTVYDVRIRIGDRIVTQTFRRRKDADAFAMTTEADKLRGIAVDPRAGTIKFETYAKRWLEQRPDLRVQTRDDYARLLRTHLVATFGTMTLASITPSKIRSWYAKVATDHPARASKAYRLLRAILNTAVSDERIIKNPCVVKGAGVDRSPERPIPTIAELKALADAMPERLELLILLAGWCGMRRGELLGLVRTDFDLLHGTVRISRAVTERSDGSIVIGEPKTAAGRRSVAIPPHIMPSVEDHLGRFVADDPNALVFTNADGERLRWRPLQYHWDRARKVVGVDYHLHDLRHFGATLAAATGASTRELMRRLGHASPVAALRYQHATEDRDAAIAAALSEMVPVATVTRIGARDRRAIDRK
jgi:integrase